MTTHIPVLLKPRHPFVVSLILSIPIIVLTNQIDLENNLVEFLLEGILILPMLYVIFVSVVGYKGNTSQSYVDETNAETFVAIAKNAAYFVLGGLSSMALHSGLNQLIG